MKFKLLLVILIAILAAPNFSYSQTNTASTILVDVLPENPAPFELVTINLNSYARNLDSVLISWSVNGRNITSGIGRKSFSTEVGDNGSETMIVASIALPEGTIEKRIGLRPATMVMLWQATDSHTPPFYRGKALPVADSEVKVVAMPEIRSGSGFVNPKSLTYSWKKNYTNDQEASGYGKNFFMYVNDYLESSDSVEVVASTTDGKYSSRGTTNIQTFPARLSFYSMSDALGINFNKSLQGNHRINGEETIVAVPYFISPKNIKIPFLSFNWSINGNPVTVQNFKKNLIPLKAGEGQSGMSKLRLDIENQSRIFQTVSKELNIEF